MFLLMPKDPQKKFYPCPKKKKNILIKKKTQLWQPIFLKRPGRKDFRPQIVVHFPRLSRLHSSSEGCFALAQSEDLGQFQLPVNPDRYEEKTMFP